MSQLLVRIPVIGMLACLQLAGITPAALAGVTDEEFQSLKREVETLKKAGKPKSIVHLSGYGAASYTDVEKGNGSFGSLLFAPIFHYQINDRVMLEAELEIEDEADGETEVKLEYLTIDVVLNDYAVLIAGKFLSPIGQFRQNVHPSWINKLPSAPPGFGHDGAAPISDTGLQVRGGFYAADQRFNYAVYAGNGPEAEIEVENEAGETEEIEMHGVENEGFSRNINDSISFGGRIAWLPVAKLEVGFSYLNAEADAEFSTLSAGGETAQLESADLTVAGADFVFLHGNTTIRGEYAKQKLDSYVIGDLATLDLEWETYYLQGSHRIGRSPYEIVLRYTDFEAAEKEETQEQTAIGFNYHFTESALLKVAFEKNDGEKNSVADRDRTILQLTYGF